MVIVPTLHNLRGLRRVAKHQKMITVHHSAKEQHFKGLVSKESPQNGSPFGFPSQEFADAWPCLPPCLPFLAWGHTRRPAQTGERRQLAVLVSPGLKTAKLHTLLLSHRRPTGETTTQLLAPRGRKSAVELGQRATFGKARIHTIGELAAHGKQGLLGVAALADDVRISATHRLPLLRAKQGNMPYGRPVLSN